MKQFYLLGILIILFSFTVFAGIEKYGITMIYKEGDWHLENLQASANEFRDKTSRHDNSDIRVHSFKGELLYNSTFYFTQDIYYDSFNASNPGGVLTREEFHFYEDVPYFYNAEKMIFENKERDLRLEVDVSQYAKCNEDSICSGFEDPELCQDCEKQVIKTDVRPDKSLPLISLGAVVVVFLLIIGFLVYRSKKLKNK